MRLSMITQINLYTVDIYLDQSFPLKQDLKNDGLSK